MGQCKDKWTSPNPMEEERQRFLSNSCYKTFGTFLSRSLNFLLSSEAPTAFKGSRLLVGGSQQNRPGPSSETVPLAPQATLVSLRRDCGVCFIG